MDTLALMNNDKGSLLGKHCCHREKMGLTQVDLACLIGKDKHNLFVIEKEIPILKLFHL